MICHFSFLFYSSNGWHAASVAVKAFDGDFWQAKILNIRVEMSKVGVCQYFIFPNTILHIMGGKPKNIWTMMQWFHCKQDLKAERYVFHGKSVL